MTEHPDINPEIWRLTPDTSPKSWRLKAVTAAYLAGFYGEIERQKAAGEEHDQDKAVRAGNSISRKVEKLFPANPREPG